MTLSLSRHLNRDVLDPSTRIYFVIEYLVTLSSRKDGIKSPNFLRISFFVLKELLQQGDRTIFTTLGSKNKT